MIIIETCPKCGHDLQNLMLASNPPIPKKECPNCGWSWIGEKDKVVRIRVFEGDCINHPLNVVEFLNGEFCVAGDRPLDMMAKYGEIVCNIHDSPELLEVSGDE